MGVHGVVCTSVGVGLAYKNKTTTKLCFFVEKKFYFQFLLILAQETRPVYQGVIHNTGVMYPPDLSKHIREAQMGILHHRCV